MRILKLIKINELIDSYEFLRVIALLELLGPCLNGVAANDLSLFWSPGHSHNPYFLRKKPLMVTNFNMNMGYNT